MTTKKPGLNFTLKSFASSFLNKDKPATEVEEEPSDIFTESSEPVKIRLSCGETMFITTQVTVEGFPNVDHPEFVWYKTALDGEFKEIHRSSEPVFYPNVTDVRANIYCQWTSSDTRWGNSNFAEVGPLLPDPAVIADAQAIIDDRTGTFEVCLPAAGDGTTTLTISGSRISLALEDGTDFGSFSVKADSDMILSRDDPCAFSILNSKGRALLAGSTMSHREREILAKLVRKFAEYKRKKQQQDVDLVQVEIKVSDESEPTKLTPSARQKLQRLEINARKMSEKNLALQKTKAVLESEVTKLKKDVGKLRRAGQTKREELNRLTREKREADKEIEELKEQKEKLEIDGRDLRRQSDEQSERISSQESKINEQETEIRDLKQLRTDLTKQLMAKDTLLDELRQEKKDLEDDRDQLKSTLNNLNQHVSKVQDERREFSDDFSKLNEEKIQLKREAREWKNSHDRVASQLERSKQEVKEMEEQHSRDEDKMNNLKQEINDLKEKNSDLSRCRTKIGELERELRDMRFEVTGRQEENNQLLSRFEETKKELEKESDLCITLRAKKESLNKKLDKATRLNSRLQIQVDDLEDRVSNTVAKSLYDETSLELEHTLKQLRDLRQKSETTTQQLMDANYSYTKSQEEVERLSEANKQLKADKTDLESHNLFWKNKVNSMRQEIQRLMDVPQAVQVQAAVPSSGRRERAKSDAEFSRLEDEKHDLEMKYAETVTLLASYKRALTDQLTKSQHNDFQHRKIKAYASEDQASLIRRNQQLLLLANDLSDAVADKESNITHLKKVLRLLGDRVREVEEENTVLRRTVATHNNNHLRSELSRLAESLESPNDSRERRHESPPSLSSSPSRSLT